MITWRDVFEYATICIGITPVQFYSFTLYEYLCTVEAHFVKEAREWKRTREISYWIYIANSTEQKKVSRSEFMPNMLDEPETVEEDTTTPERIEELRQIAMQRLEALKQNNP